MCVTQCYPVRHSMAKILPLDTKHVRRLAILNGFDGVKDLAARVGRRRETVWRALRNPHRYGPTIRAVGAALERRWI